MVRKGKEDKQLGSVKKRGMLVGGVNNGRWKKASAVASGNEIHFLAEPRVQPRLQRRP